MQTRPLLPGLIRQRAIVAVVCLEMRLDAELHGAAGGAAGGETARGVPSAPGRSWSKNRAFRRLRREMSFIQAHALGRGERD